MEKSKLDEMDNASLMSFVKEARLVIPGGFSEGMNTTAMWNGFHLLRYAESLMKFRNLPLDHEKLGPKFGVPEFRDRVLIVTKNEDQKTD